MQRIIMLAVTVAALVAPAFAAVAPFTSAQNAVPASNAEWRVWWSADEMVEAFHHSGVLYADETATGYVQHVAERLFPEFGGKLTVHIVKSAELNAFVLANGHIYVTIGLLARLQNEAQLATALAHEGTHFTHRHAFLTRQTIRSSTALASMINMLGVPIVPQALALSSILGYSRELETEADMVGYKRLTAAGYDVRESPKTFEHLIRDIQVEGIEAPYFFSTHPKLQDRVDNLKRLSVNASAGGAGSSMADYAAAMSTIRVENLEALLSMDRARQALIMLEDPQRLAELPPFGYYYLGEAYRRRGGRGDLAAAERAYLHVAETVPEFAPTYRALGVLHLNAKNWAEAKTYLARYLELEPDAKDRKYVEAYLKTARDHAGP
jgi:beta-barrel assembly-enhancing protease